MNIGKPPSENIPEESIPLFYLFYFQNFTFKNDFYIINRYKTIFHITYHFVQQIFSFS